MFFEGDSGGGVNFLMIDSLARYAYLAFHVKLAIASFLGMECHGKIVGCK